MAKGVSLSMDQILQQAIIKINQSYKIPSKIVAGKPLHGGTVSRVWLLTDEKQYQYVLKQNVEVNEEVFYLKSYQSIDLLPNVLFFDRKQQFYVYEYVSGRIQKSIRNKQAMLMKLVRKLWAQAVVVTPTKWGWASQPLNNWSAFLLAEINEAKPINDQILSQESYTVVAQLTKDQRHQTQAYLLHGDCGIHNLLQIDNQVVAVIDPQTLYGDRLFELVATFCSSPEQLTEETLRPAVELLLGEYPKEEVVEGVLIGLYLRMYRCYWHHREDLPQYLLAWDDWLKKYQVN